MTHALSKTYEPERFESTIYQDWESKGCFQATDQCRPGQVAFSMVIPPPNITGALHMGHALTNTIQDILVRWRRMRGDNALWLPGTDHAGIATQAQVEKMLAKEGLASCGKPLTRHDLGREKWLERTWKWKNEHGSIITEQLKKLGSSLDWKRERFTLDEGLSQAVREVFVRLYNEGLLYRGERIIHWCVGCQTALSDVEVVPIEQKGSLWYLKYAVVGNLNKTQNLIIATTRPETLLGDTGIAVHPEDPRYLHLIGKKALVPLVNRVVPIVGDSYVDPKMGTGALKVTPAHDFNDYELAKRHALPFFSIMGKDGKVNAEGGVYQGLSFSEARKRVLEDLDACGAFVETKEHVNRVGHCQRCEKVVEPILSKQWFVKIASLAEPAIQAVKERKIQFFPESWEKNYFEWMYAIQDWCISRQLWWGHRIPAWYCEQCEGISVSKGEPLHCHVCQAPLSQLKQDEDVLDTWFSSALWPFSTLGWPDKTEALKTFYPTSILETGFDILFFWVARMIMMGIHFMGEVPFRRVYLHAMVRDEKGQKMSKTKGNVIDPLQLIDQYGADPLRFTLSMMAGQGRDIRLSLERVEGYRAFCNKLWNAVKFFHFQLERIEQKLPPAFFEDFRGGLGGWLEEHYCELSLENQWILSRLQRVIEKVEQGLEGFELHLSAQSLYEFTWHALCDWFIEFSKLSFKEGGKETQNVALQSLFTLGFVLDALLRLLHPFIPFVTEELWRSLPWKKSKQEGPVFLMLQAFPEQNPKWIHPEAERKMEMVQRIIEAIRNFRGENALSPKASFSVAYLLRESFKKDPIEYESLAIFLEKQAPLIVSLSRITEFKRKVGFSKVGSQEAVIPLGDPPLELSIPLKGLVDVQEELKRLEKEIEKTEKDLQFVKNKLSQELFLQKAPAVLIEKEKKREKELMMRQRELFSARERFKKMQ